MRRFSLVTVSCLLFCSRFAVGEDVQIFNGKDIDGWKLDLGSSERNEKFKKEDIFRVQNGAIVGRGILGDGALRHGKQFEAEYALSLEWRWGPSTASGADILLHSSNEKNEIGRRKEIRVSLSVDEAGGISYRGGPDRFNTTKERMTERELEKDLGQWNRLVIICRQKMMTVVVNGQPVNQVTDVPFSKGVIGLGTSYVPIYYRNVKITQTLGAEHARYEAAAKPLSDAWAKTTARKKAEQDKKDQARLVQEKLEAEREAQQVTERQNVIQSLRATVASETIDQGEPKRTITSLPFPRDAREIDFSVTSQRINFKSASSIKSLAAFYLRELAKRGWDENEAKSEMDDDTVQLTFEASQASLEVELDQYSKDVRVTIETEGIDFSGSDDPATLAAHGIPLPRRVLLLQKMIPIPSDAQRFSFDDDSFMFYSTMKLEEAFQQFSDLIKKKGFRESRKPIIKSTRNYTKFKNRGIELSLNIFRDPVGARIIIEYDDGKKDPAIPPLSESISTSVPEPPTASPTNIATERKRFAETAPPRPNGVDDFVRSGTKFSKTFTASTDESTPAVLEFYRTTLSSQGWAKLSESKAKNSHVLQYRNPSGPMSIRLTASNGRTEISITKIDQQKAEREGVFPETGKGRLILANAIDKNVVYTIGTTDYPVKAGAGGKSLQDALNYSVSPGKYIIQVKIQGQQTKTETIQITEGSAWAMIATPTVGHVAMRLL